MPNVHPEIEKCSAGKRSDDEITERCDVPVFGSDRLPASGVAGQSVSTGRTRIADVDGPGTPESASRDVAIVCGRAPYTSEAGRLVHDSTRQLRRKAV